MTDASGIPLRLNIGRAPEVGAEAAHAGMLGTLAFTRQFEGRLQQALRAETAEDHLPYSQWHRSPYVLRRLRARLGSDIIRAIMAKRAAIEALYVAAESRADWDDWRVWRQVYDAAVEKALTPFALTERTVEQAERNLHHIIKTQLMSYRRSRARNPD